MEELVKERPKTVTFIGWFLIFVSVVSFLSGTFGILNLDKVGIKYQLFSYPVSIAFYLYGLVYTTVLIAVSVQFLRLKSWARRWLVFLTWMYIVLISVETLYFTSRKDFYAIQMLIDSGIEINSTIKTLIILIYILIKGIGVTIAAFIIKFLRSKPIKEAMLKMPNIT